MSIASRALLLLLTGSMLSGCAVGKDYDSPRIGLPGLFSNTKKAESALAMQDQASIEALSEWWTAFNDPTMNELVIRALNNNQNLQRSAAVIAESRALRRTTIGALLPSVDATAGVSRGDAAAGGVGAGGVRDGSTAGFDASWEVDLFGGNRRRLESSDAALEAAIADYNGTALQLAAEVARQYIEYRHLQHQVALARDSVTTQEDILELTQDLYDADLTSGLEVSQAESIVRTTAAAVPQYERQLEATRQTLAVLLGITSDELPMDQLEKATPVPMAKNLPFMDAPAAVLGRRPDIIAAERRLASAAALSSAELARLFPTVSISGLFGVQDNGSTNFGGGGIWSVAANAAMPLLNFGTIQGQIDAQRAREKQAYHAYRQTVLEAVADVETSLSGFAYETRHRDALWKAVDSNHETLRLARARYENGLTAFTDVLQAQQDLFVSEQQLAMSEASQAQALVAVYKSLGVAPMPKTVSNDD